VNRLHKSGKTWFVTERELLVARDELELRRANAASYQNFFRAALMQAGG
jgi:hypothetical protein